jgi:hypothetical protein
MRVMAEHGVFVENIQQVVSLREVSHESTHQMG